MKNFLFWVVMCVVCGVGCARTIDEKDRSSARIHYDMAVSSMNENDMRTALRELLTSVQLDPELTVAHNALGLTYHSLGMPDEALDHYRQAIKRDPKFSDAHNNMGVLLMDVGRYDEAIGAFKVALGDILYPSPFLAEGNMGWAYYKSGDINTGIRHVRNAVATNPKFCRGYEWLMRIALEQNNPDEVVLNGKRFEKYCLQDETLASAIPASYVKAMRYYLGLGYLKQGKAEEARQAFTSCADAQAENGFEKKCAQSLAGL